jgi:hypothetical protein
VSGSAVQYSPRFLKRPLFWGSGGPSRRLCWFGARSIRGPLRLPVSPRSRTVGSGGAVSARVRPFTRAVSGANELALLGVFSAGGLAGSRMRRDLLAFAIPCAR